MLTKRDPRCTLFQPDTRLGSKMKRKHSIPIGLILVLAVTLSCANEVIEEASEYEKVTIEELTGNATKYDGMKVEVTGEYIPDMGVSCPAMVCPPCDWSKAPLIEEYIPLYDGIYRGIREDRITIAFRPPTKNGIVEMPDVIRGQETLLRGEAEAFIIPPPCCGCAFYKSLLIRAYSITPILN
jgi:hypothetical protein